MSGPIVRVAVQFVMLGVNIVSKAFMQAYAQAKAGGGATSAARSVANAGRMPLDQARQVLNIESRVPLSAEDVNKNFMKYYEANDPEKGGSFYIQSKVWNAKETLQEEMRRMEAARRAAAELRNAENKGAGGGGSAGGRRTTSQRFDDGRFFLSSQGSALPALSRRLSEII